MSKKSLGEVCADRLFHSGLGDEAHRLVLVSMHGRDLGGWCKQAVIDQIDEAARGDDTAVEADARPGHPDDAEAEAQTAPARVVTTWAGARAGDHGSGPLHGRGYA